MKKLFTLNNIFLLVLLLGIQFTKAQTLQVSSPNGGEVWIGGSSHTITWTYANVDNIKIEYSLNNGLNWTILTFPFELMCLSGVSFQSDFREVSRQSTRFSICLLKKSPAHRLHSG